MWDPLAEGHISKTVSAHMNSPLGSSDSRYYCQAVLWWCSFESLCVFLPRWAALSFSRCNTTGEITSNHHYSTECGYVEFFWSTSCLLLTKRRWWSCMAGERITCWSATPGSHSGGLMMWGSLPSWTAMFCLPSMPFPSTSNQEVCTNPMCSSHISP